MQHQQLDLLQPGQRAVVDPADAVEPTGAQKLQSLHQVHTRLYCLVTRARLPLTPSLCGACVWAGREVQPAGSERYSGLR